MPIPALLAGVGTGLSVLSNIFGIGKGLSQNAQGRRMMRQAGDLPTYQVNQSLYDNLAQSKLQENGISNASNMAAERIGANQAGTVFNARQAAPSGSALLGVLGTSQAQSNDAMRQLAIQDEQMKQQNQNQMLQAAKAVSEAEQFKFQGDFARTSALRKDAMDLKDAGASNIMGGITGLSGAAGAAYDMESTNKVFSTLFADLFGGKQAPSMGGSSLDQQSRAMMKSRLDAILRAPMGTTLNSGALVPTLRPIE